MKKLAEIIKTKLPLIQAPMAGSQDADLAIAVCNAGGLGSLPCASISHEKIKNEVEKIRSQTDAPFNLNFFCHVNPDWEEKREEIWKKTLEPYFIEFGLDVNQNLPPSSRNPFDEDSCKLIEELRPPVVSFHFGLPHQDFIKRIKKTGAVILSSATTVEEAIWLEKNGCDAIIAQGLEAGGHRGIFLSKDLSTQLGTMSLVPKIVDAVKIPVIASGGIADTRGVKACFELGAVGIQIGTAYLFTHEAKISVVHKEALLAPGPKITALTNIFTGRPARGIVNRIMREIGPITNHAPEFPLAGGRLAPLKKISEERKSGDFSSLWAGQSVELGQVMSAEELTKKLMSFNN